MKKIFGMVVGCVLFFAATTGHALTNEGFYLSPGISGVFQMGGENRDFEPGPGFQLDFGHRWQKVAWRAKFLVSFFDDENIPFGGRDRHVGFVHFGTDVLLYPLEFTSMAGGDFQPYILGGFGPYFATEGNSEREDDNASGMGGNIGFGMDYQIAQEITLGMEHNFHFLGLIEEQNRGGFLFDDTNAFSLFFYSVTLHMGFHF